MDKNALIKCPYCNNVVPKNVLLCPHCNHILRDERNMEGNEELNIANNSQDNNVFSNNTNPVFVFNQDSEKKTKPVFSINKLMFLFIGILIGASIACLTILGISRFSINDSKQNTDMLETQADKKKLQEETTDINNVFDGETQEKAKTDEAADGMPSNSYASIGIGENVLVNTEDGDVEISVDGGSLVDWNIYDGGNRTGAGTAIASIRCKIKNISHEHWEYLGYSLASSGYFQLLDENDVAVAYYDISGPVDGVYEPNVDVAKGATRYVSMPFVVNDNLTKASVVLGKQYLLEIDFDKTGELINNNTEAKTNGIVNSMGNDEDVGQDTPEEKHVDKNIDNIESDFVYVNNGSEVQINGYTGRGGHVVIPDQIEGSVVTRIATNAFRGATNITSIVLPKQLKFIGDSAFYGLKNLSGIVLLPETMTEMEGHVFQSTKITGVLVQSSCTVGINAFANIPTLKYFYVKDGCAPKIGISVFGYSESLEIVIFPSTVIDIEAQTFEGCNKATIYTPAGSYAEEYAKNNFISVNTERYAEEAEAYQKELEKYQ